LTVLDILNLVGGAEQAENWANGSVGSQK